MSFRDISDVPELAVTLKVSNNRMKRLRLDLGLSTHEAAEDAGVSYFSWIALENMKRSPRGRGHRGSQYEDWTPTAKKVAKFFGAPPDEVFPEAVRRVTTSTVTRELSADDLAALIGRDEPPQLPDAALEVKDLSRLTGDVLDHVQERKGPRHRLALVMRFGLEGNDEHTLEDVGRHLLVHRERARQIISSALACIRRLTENRNEETAQGLVDAWEG